ncbi:MFS transporter [Alicyclobacillus sendaiensis]|uniref:MFS transporter n=1 Tax=Alicyclobacillus sendaiensis TaxID=192387 RepID=UPI0026F423E0|nr:MFS transporter [Alicyclobacillus sendaiensis]
MNRINNQIIILLCGSALTGAAISLIVPYLSIYLSRNTNLSPSLIGLIVGAAPLASVIGGFLGGAISDAIGYKKVMVLSLIFDMLSSICFVSLTGFWPLFIVNFIGGMARMSFSPAEQSMLMLLTTNEDHRDKVLGHSYTAFNIGYVIGMLAGSTLANLSMKAMFYGSASVILVYLFVLLFFVDNKNVETGHKLVTPMKKLKDSIIAPFSDGRLLLIICGGILFNFAFCQITTSLPLNMSNVWGREGVHWYAYLIITNTLLVISIQIPVSKILSGSYILMISAPLTLLSSFVVFALKASIGIYFSGIVLYTCAEILSFTGVQRVLLMLSNSRNKGGYFGAWSFRMLGNFFGPSLGIFVMEHYSFRMLCVICSALCIASILCYMLSYGMNRSTRSDRSLWSAE